jgi:hypothetical protein
MIAIVLFELRPFGSQGIRLEGGHNRATAAVLAGVLPRKIKMYIGDDLAAI